MVNPVLGDAGEWVSRVFKDQVLRRIPQFGCLVSGLWISRQRFLSVSSKCMYVVVLLHFENAEFALEGIRQFFVAGEIEEVKLNAFCDMRETPWYCSSGFPVGLPLFGITRVVSEWMLRELWS